MHHPFHKVLVSLIACLSACTTPKSHKENTTSIVFIMKDQNTGLIEILLQAKSDIDFENV